MSNGSNGYNAEHEYFYQKQDLFASPTTPEFPDTFPSGTTGPDGGVRSSFSVMTFPQKIGVSISILTRYLWLGLVSLVAGILTACVYALITMMLLGAVLLVAPVLLMVLLLLLLLSIPAIIILCMWGFLRTWGTILNNLGETKTTSATDSWNLDWVNEYLNSQKSGSSNYETVKKARRKASRSSTPCPGKTTEQ